MLSRNNLKAATFIGAMLLTEYCFSGAGEEAHHHHHHHDENYEYMAGIVARFLGGAALVLANSARFGVSRYFHNNSMAMGVGEAALSYYLTGGNALLACGRGLFGVAVAQGINVVADPDNKPAAGAARKNH